MLGLPQPADVAVDLAIIRRVRENQVHRFVKCHGCVVSRVAGIAANQAMTAQLPKVASLADRLGRERDDGILHSGLRAVRIGVACGVEGEVDVS